MADWTSRLDAFLQFNEYQILKDAGKVSHEVAMKLVENEYAKFRVIQDQNFVSDFEQEVKNHLIGFSTEIQFAREGAVIDV